MQMFFSNKPDDDFPQIRAKAAESLGKISDRIAVETLINHLLNETDLETRQTIIQSLGQIGTEKVLSYLIQSLTDQNPKVRAIAAIALGEIGTEATLAELSQACSDKDDDVRLSAVDALGKIGYRYALN
jgi:HEAT repeat protein